MAPYLHMRFNRPFSPQFLALSQFFLAGSHGVPAPYNAIQPPISGTCPLLSYSGEVGNSARGPLLTYAFQRGCLGRNLRLVSGSVCGLRSPYLLFR
jgi:hypothetical protein